MARDYRDYVDGYCYSCGKLDPNDALADTATEPLCECFTCTTCREKLSGYLQSCYVCLSVTCRECDTGRYWVACPACASNKAEWLRR